MSDILTKALEEQNYLMHHGILGQKWGVRRYQNPDGSLTEEGRKRYLDDSGKLNSKGKKIYMDNGDGTYYDVTKYTRKLGLVGGAIDLARNAKRNKQLLRDLKKMDDDDNTYNKNVLFPKTLKSFEDSGWKNETKGDTTWTTKNGKIDGNDVEYMVMNTEYTMGKYGDSTSRANLVNNDVRKLELGEKKAIKNAKEQIAKDLYDDYGIVENVSRKDFINSLKLESVFFTGDGDVELNFYSPEVGGHSLDVEMDLNDYTPRYTSVNG